MSHLPLEIISCIIASVPSKSTLCRIARCSSIFYSLTVPILYAHVSLYSIGCGDFKHLRSLTVLFLTKPTLAHYVRYFTLRDPLSRAQPGSHHNQMLEVVGDLKEAVLSSSHSAGEFERWINDIEVGCPDALLAILLPTMVRLEKLDLMIRSDYSYFDRMITRAVNKKRPFDGQPLFSVLTNFMHAQSWYLEEWDEYPDEWDWYNQRMSFKYALLFQNFPRIRSIFGNGVSDYYGPEKDMIETFGTAERRTSSLTHLELKNSFTVHLRTILKIPKALVTFIYEKGFGDNPLQASVTDVLHALVPQQNSLENLWLDCKDVDDMWCGPWNAYDEMNLLSKFIHLKNLRIGSLVIYLFLNENKWDSLQSNVPSLIPVSLETLHIIGPVDGEIGECCRDFLLAVLNQVHRLRTVYMESGGFPREWKDLQEKAKSNAVDLIALIQTKQIYCERGWGMDGSIEWGSCLPFSNEDHMLLLSEWKEDGEADYKLGPDKASNGKCFYKWPLCRTDANEKKAEDRKTDTAEIQNQGTDDNPILDPEGSGYEAGGEESSDAEAIFDQETNDQGLFGNPGKSWLIKVWSVRPVLLASVWTGKHGWTNELGLSVWRPR
jgi:hypothetical protein